MTETSAKQRREQCDKFIREQLADKLANAKAASDVTACADAIAAAVPRCDLPLAHRAIRRYAKAQNITLPKLACGRRAGGGVMPQMLEWMLEQKLPVDMADAEKKILEIKPSTTAQQMKKYVATIHMIQDFALRRELKK